MNKTDLVKIKVPGKPEFIKVCRSAALATASLVGFDVDTVDEIGMAVFEACKVVTCHGYDCWCSEYEMDIRTEDDGLTIEILSSGSHTVEKDCEICLDCPSEGDLGISIINSIMDSVSIENTDDGGKKIILVKKNAR